MSDPMKNPDPNDMQRRDLGDEEDRDGLDVAEKLYGGLPTDSDKIDPETDAE
ncbi:hypothetical protein GGQ05_003564 [Salinibacter ruber]|uniref:hypothetical protein n=1 Tax=Salinibacter ruber TaxID=146919 RepID=UPI00216A8FF7|nr:hypothetical protein [Salinibacter ruber]MCS4172072.1 hypothetical protein [Salinibacter ruber]